MQHLPLFATLTNLPCLVIGGGAVAVRKVTQLLATGARVTVNAPAFSPGLQALGAAGSIRLIDGPFAPELVPDHLLVIAATSDRTVNHAVAAAARAALRLCNVVDDPAASSFISPSVVDRSPLLVAVSTGGAAPVLARLLRQHLERALPAGLGALATWAGRWRATIQARVPDPGSRRRLWERIFSDALDERPGIGTDVVAGNPARADTALLQALDAGDSPPVATGEAWLVGAGPGDPELLTLRGFRLLQHADVILHDRLVAPALLAFARRDAEIIDVGKTGGGPSASQAAINALLVSRVRAGQRVCRLKGGDPYVFGRGSEEALALAEAGLRFQVIPGITAASGCGAYAGIPLTHRDTARAVTFVTGHPTGDGTAAPELDWAALAAPGQTLVVYMTGRRLPDVTGALLRHGRPGSTPAAVVIAGTTEAQRCITGTLEDIAWLVAGAGVASPAILYVGDVVALRTRLDWFRPGGQDGAAPAGRTYNTTEPPVGERAAAGGRR